MNYSNSIKIDAFDNELYIIAYNLKNRFQLCHLKNGDFLKKSMTINICEGGYWQPETIDLSYSIAAENELVTLPRGDYNIIAIAINKDQKKFAKILINEMVFSFGKNKLGAARQKTATWTNNAKLPSKIYI